MPADAAAVVLAGGRSRRMEADKARLDWHGVPLVRRVVGILARAVAGPVVVVRAAGQELPALPPDVEVVDDPVPEEGPLRGLAAGLAAVAARAPVAVACATDLPLLHPAIVRRVVAALEPPGGLDASLAPGAVRPAPDATVPLVRGRLQPLTAAYRCGPVAAAAAAALAAGERSLGALLVRCAVAELDEPALLADPALAAADPDLASVTGVNTPEDLAAARARPAPAVDVRLDGGVAVTVRAWDLGAAAAALAVTLGACPQVRVGDLPVDADPAVPLVAGDVVDLLRS